MAGPKRPNASTVLLLIERQLTRLGDAANRNAERTRWYDVSWHERDSYMANRMQRAFPTERERLHTGVEAFSLQEAREQFKMEYGGEPPQLRIVPMRDEQCRFCGAGTSETESYCDTCGKSAQSALDERRSGRHPT